MGKMKSEQKPIDKLLDVFVNSLDLSSAPKYRQVTNAFCKAFPDDKGILEDLSAIININDYVSLKEKTQDAINQYKKKSSYKSYLNKFIVFLDTYSKKNSGDIASKDFDISNKELCKIFTSRLRSQDRLSGDKIWLPLDYIAQIYRSKENKKSTTFTKWMRELAKEVYVHYEDGDEIKSEKFSNEKVSLKFVVHKDEKGCNSDKYDVKVVKDDKEYIALSPTGTGNEKVPMIVKSIRDIAIDHIISIDKTLKDLENKLGELEKVSNLFKSKQNEELSDDVEKEKLNGINLDALTNNMNSIKNYAPLRLMAAEYNSKKSNGETFSKIIKKGNNYWGILAENIYNKEDENQKMTLCQKLTKTKKENGRLCIFPKEEMEGDDVKMRYICANNIDYI